MADPLVAGCGHEPVSLREVRELSELSAISGKYVIGRMLRQWRIAAGRTQPQVAAGLHVSAQAIHLYEAGRRTASPQMLQRWCEKLDVPLWKRRKLAALIAAGLDQKAPDASPPHLDALDRARIESLNVPAWYLATPTCDILHANQAAETLFPWAGAAPATSERPTNMIEQFVTDPRAAATIANWVDIIGPLICRFRVYSPGVVPMGRIAEIVEACSDNPAFGQLWRSDLDDHQMQRSELLITSIHGTTRWNLSHHCAAGRSHELLLLTPMTPSVGACMDRR
ncbi:helix-turn-helix domain-containing protein (plasmid) [Nocardia sp. CA-084685]|uniref:helix-turn-helix domain-containing protein n=1 Tax=Nocardia sp. CA-084685 TaxID=3239970 RepID=UPI003D98CE28